MNIWKEKYPKNINEMIRKGNRLIKEVEKTLNAPQCPCLGELYSFSKDKKIRRNKDAFLNLNYFPNTTLNSKSKTDDEISGLYVFGEKDKNGKIKPKYTGISRTIFRRLRQHGWGKMHNDATFAYLMATVGKEKIKGQRKYMTAKELERHQKILRTYKVAILPEKDFYDMYFMEVYFAGIWKTEWNSFKTH